MKYSTNYYRQLYNSIKQLESQCKEVNYKVLPSTINYKRKSKFIKSNSNTNKLHKKIGWDSYKNYEIHNHETQETYVGFNKSHVSLIFFCYNKDIRQN